MQSTSWATQLADQESKRPNVQKIKCSKDQMSERSNVQKTKCPKDQMSKSPSVQKAKSHEIKSLKNKGQKVQVSERPKVKKVKCLEVHLYQRPNVQKSMYPKDQMSTRPLSPLGLLFYAAARNPTYERSSYTLV